MMKDLIILGTGDCAREIAHVVERINEASGEAVWNILGFSTDREELVGTTVDGYEVICTDAGVNEWPEEVYVICSLGIARARRRVVGNITNPRVKYATLIDPDAKIFRDTEIGEGSIICAGNVLSINVKVGKHVIINWNCSIGHDAVIEDYSVINPGVNISGKVTVGTCTDIGVGSKVIQGLTIGSDTTVGAGGVVVQDIPPKCLALGVPAKPVKFFE